MNVYVGTSGELSKAFIGENPTWKPNANTVAYRPLTATTTVNDQSGNNYNLTQTGGSFTTLNGVSCFYNGGSTTGYLNLTSGANIPSGSSARTISLWAYPTSYSSSYNRHFLKYGQNSSGKAIMLQLSTGQKYFGGVYTSNITGNTMPTNAWSLLTLVTSGNDYYLYANGQLEGNATTTINTAAVSSSYPLRLMRDSQSTSGNYQVRGYLSEVIIENKAWTATEVENYFNDNKSKYGL